MNVLANITILAAGSAFISAGFGMSVSWMVGVGVFFIILPVVVGNDE